MQTPLVHLHTSASFVCFGNCVLAQYIEYGVTLVEPHVSGWGECLFMPDSYYFSLATQELNEWEPGRKTFLDFTLKVTAVIVKPSILQMLSTVLSS